MSELEERPVDELVAEAKDGNPEAFERLVERSVHIAKRVAYGIVGAEGVDDVLQETYLSAFLHLHELAEPKAFFVWISRIALHASYQVQRKRPVTQPLEEHQLVAESTDVVVDTMTVRQALARLPQADREILVFREMLESSYEDIARALLISVGTVKSRLHKARRLLKERMPA